MFLKIINSVRSAIRCWFSNMTNTVHTLTLSDVKYDKQLGEISAYTSG